MPADTARRTAWVSYVRVSTADQAERDLSIPAQRHAIEEYAVRHGSALAHEYVEAGCSGRDPHRPEFRRMLGDVLAPGSDIATIVVHHTSRFTRDSTEARLVKRRLRKAGVRVLSVCQEIQDDPVGKLVEGLFECIDQYESEINGARTSSALREALRQGFFPGSRAPFGYTTSPVEVGPGAMRRRLVPCEDEASVVRLLFRLYIANNGAKTVARILNQRGLRHRDAAWTKDLVLNVLDDKTVAGTYYWGRHVTREQIPRPRSEWLALAVEPIVDPNVHALARELRSAREPARSPGRAPSPAHALTGLLRCGRCGASCQLETSGKRVEGVMYKYAYYNCRSACRAGREVCAGHRIRTATLDAAVLAHVADVVCTPERVELISRRLREAVAPDVVTSAWRALIEHDHTVTQGYLRQLVAKIVVYENRIVVEPKALADPRAGI
jgi:site-specific DNA recombinase